MKLFCLSVATLGAVAIYEGWRIANAFRQPGSFGVVGPDRYLLGVGIAVTLLALIATFQKDSSPRAVVESDGSWKKTFSLSPILLSTIGYAVALPLIGYLPATFGFFLAGFHGGGVKSIPELLAASILATLALYVVFIRIASLSFSSVFFG